jgi:Mn2+/Fe2+ NRAMP family transporter
MHENTLERLDLLGKALFLAAVALLVGSVVGAIVIGTSSSHLFFIGKLQHDNRNLLAAAAFAAGFAGSCLIAGIAALVRLNVAAIRDRG